MQTTTCKYCQQTFEYEPFIIYGEDVVKPWFCKACGERVNREAAENRIAEEQAKLLRAWNNICPPLYQATDPSRLPQEQLARVLKWEYGPCGLTLCGKTGKGKTRAAFQLLHRLHFDEGRRIVAFTGNGFAHECATRFGNGQTRIADMLGGYTQRSGESWIAEIANAHVVFLDDFGKCRLTERVEAELFGLIETRTANMLPVILTTNFNGDDLEKKLSPDRGAPLVRRLRDFCETIVFP